MDGIIRVFPERTNYTPDDPMSFVGMPPFRELIPKHKEIQVSCTFSWDKPKAEAIAEQWEFITGERVKLGGVAYGSDVDRFTPGMYVKRGITFTTRGCNNNCPWCIVPRLEGKFREIDITPGNIIQDNNFLMSSRGHKEKVFEMLKHQTQIEFRGGLEPDLIDEHFAENARSLRIKALWLACDTDARIPAFKKGCAILRKAGFTRAQIRCYALSYGQDMAKDEARCREIYEAGALPFVQLYKDPTKEIQYSAEWKAWARQWSRPAASKAHMKGLEKLNE